MCLALLTALGLFHFHSLNNAMRWKWYLQFCKWGNRLEGVVAMWHKAKWLITVWAFRHWPISTCWLPMFQVLLSKARMTVTRCMSLSLARAAYAYAISLCGWRNLQTHSLVLLSHFPFLNEKSISETLSKSSECFYFFLECSVFIQGEDQVMKDSYNCEDI